MGLPNPRKRNLHHSARRMVLKISPSFWRGILKEKMKMAKDSLYSSKEVAEKLNLSIQRINQARESLKIGKKFGTGKGFYLYSEKDIDKIKERIGKSGHSLN